MPPRHSPYFFAPCENLPKRQRHSVETFFFILTPFVIDLNYYYKRVKKFWKKKNKSLSL